MRTSTTLRLAFKNSPFYSDDVKEGTYQISVSMQTIPITITKTDDTSIVIKSEKLIAYASEDTFLLLNLNAKKMRVMGKAQLLQN